MTTAGLIVGTPDYMSPEQARGDQIDARSDIFSVGGVFYFMLTGRKPFPASDLPSVFHQVETEDPLPLESREAPPALAHVVMKALVKDKQMRYQTCQELMADLVTLRPHYSLDAQQLDEHGLDAAIGREVPMTTEVESVSITDETVDSMPPPGSESGGLDSGGPDSGDTVTISTPSTWAKQVGDRVESAISGVIGRLRSSGKPARVKGAGERKG
jgi:serine/threonine protein kinase